MGLEEREMEDWVEFRVVWQLKSISNLAHAFNYPEWPKKNVWTISDEFHW